MAGSPNTIWSHLLLLVPTLPAYISDALGVTHHLRQSLSGSLGPAGLLVPAEQVAFLKQASLEGPSPGPGLLGLREDSSQ